MIISGKIHTNVRVSERTCVLELYRSLGLIDNDYNICVEFKDGKVYRVTWQRGLREDYPCYNILYDNEFDDHIAKQLVDAYREYLDSSKNYVDLEHSRAIKSSKIVRKLTRSSIYGD